MKAFTLVELSIAILVFTFIVGGMYSVLNIANTNYGTNLVSLNLQRQARQGMSRLSREIREACLSSIVSGEGDGTITFDTPDANGVTYSMVSGQLWRNYPTGTVIANGITDLIFYPIVGNIQKITLKASKTFHSLGTQRTPTFSLTEQVQVRNP